MTEPRSAKQVVRRHDLSYSDSPIGYQVFCSCGWSHFERRQNALARAAKMKAAIRRHMEIRPTPEPRDG